MDDQLPGPPAGSQSPVPAYHATVDRLVVAPLTVLGAFSHASNSTLLVHLGDRHDPPDPGDGVTLGDLDSVDLGIWKPVRGQRPLWDFDATTLPCREVAAWLVDSWLGFDLVPATVWRADGPFGPGSLQAHVAHDPAAHYFTWRDDETRTDHERLADLVVLDLMINNTDRKAGHLLVADDRIWAIDHGVTFHVDEKLRTVAWDLQGELVPPQLREAAEGLANNLDDRDFVRPLERHLSRAEVVATIDRARAVAAMVRFPVLTDRHQLPWPLV